jgi:hypothetical protein
MPEYQTRPDPALALDICKVFEWFKSIKVGPLEITQFSVRPDLAVIVGRHIAAQSSSIADSGRPVLLLELSMIVSASALSTYNHGPA